jgi:hypothetical protein
VNERLARHYGIAGIYGSRFRRVTLPNPISGGLLAEAPLATNRIGLRSRSCAAMAAEHLRLARATAAARRRHQPDGQQVGRGAKVDPRAAGAASPESVVQQLSLVIDPLGFALEH